MMTLNQNKSELYYSLFVVQEQIYETDSDGNIIYIMVDGERVPVESGDAKTYYTEPVKMLANIAFQSNETVAQEFGVNMADYDAIIVYGKEEYPITETSRIWYESEIKYLDVEKTMIDPDSADYKVVSVRKTLNESKAILRHLAK